MRVEDVRRLDVTVQHAGGVRVGDGVRDLDTEIAGLDGVQRRVAHPLGVRTVAQFHDQVWVLVDGDPDVEQVDHVRVGRHPTGRSRLAQKAGLVPVADQRPVLHLHGDLATHRDLRRPVDGGVATSGEYLQISQTRHDGRRQGAGRGVGHNLENTELCRPLTEPHRWPAPQPMFRHRAGRRRAPLRRESIRSRPSDR